MPRKPFRTDFFTVEMPKRSNMTFGDILTLVASSPDDKNRWAIVKHSPVCLGHAVQAKDLIAGDLVRLRVGDGAIKGTTERTSLEEITLLDDEALAEPSAFLFHIPSGTLALERNRIGVSASSMAQYCETKSGLSPIIMEPLLQEAAIKRLATVSDFRKFSFRVSGIKDAEFLGNEGWSGSQILDIMKKFQAPSVEITLSMGYDRNGSLAKTSIISAAQKLYANLSRADSAVSKLVITGKTDDDEKTVLDLIKDCIRDEVMLDYNGRLPPYVTRSRAVSEAWTSHRAEILRLKGQGG